MADLKPMFPLKLIVFPGERVNLHIFEPRYKQLIGESVEDKTTFYIPPVIDDALQTYATEMIVLRVEKAYPDGKMDIRTQGTSVGRIENFTKTLKGKLYGGAEVTPVPTSLQGSLLKNSTLIDLASKLHTTMQIEKTLPVKTETGLSFKLGHIVGLNTHQEYELLQIPDEEERQDYLIAHLEMLIPIVREMQAMKEKIRMNGHFKNIIPPEVD